MASVDRREEGDGYGASQARSPSVSWTAWIASSVGLVLFLGSVGILGYEGLFNSGGHPVIELGVEEVSYDGRRWHARIRAQNTGGSTGAHVRVAGDLLSAGEVVETTDVVFDYLPAGSTQRGGLFFQRDPAAHEIRLRVLGYAEP